MITQIRSMQESDLPFLIEVQRQTFTEDLCESLAVFKNRFDRFGEFFKVALINDKIVGYLICFPYKLGTIPENNKPFDEFLETPDCFYLHDITLLKEARGSGLAQKLIAHAIAASNEMNLRELVLVAVAQSGNYWDKLGFAEYLDMNKAMKQKLISYYGNNARLMTKISFY